MPSASHILALLQKSTAFRTRTPNPDPVPFPPINVRLPLIFGQVTTGSLLTIDKGRWEGSFPQTYTYQWRSDGVPITGATGLTYIGREVDESHVITCAVTSTNATGTFVTAISLDAQTYQIFTEEEDFLVTEDSINIEMEH